MFTMRWISLVICLAVTQAAMPLPFTRPLKEVSPQMQGADVGMLQHFLERCSGIAIAKTGLFDVATVRLVRMMQSTWSLPVDGIFGADTAAQVLKHCTDDGYRDDGLVPAGYMYKVIVPVHRNRSIETTGRLLNAKGEVLLNFTARTMGQRLPHGEPRNQFTSNGQTPTGLYAFDLNSPEPDPKLYGPYPVNRAVWGLKGNAGMTWDLPGRQFPKAHLVPDVRNGLLLHTGQWDGWNPRKPMPDSHGCIHAHPSAVETIWHLLTKLGVQTRPNPLGALPYKYKPQGLLSIELVS